MDKQWMNEIRDDWSDDTLTRTAKMYRDEWHHNALARGLFLWSDYVYRYRVLVNEMDRRGLN